MELLMSSLLFRHDFTARACIPPRGATLKIASCAEMNLQHNKELFISAFSASSAVKISFE